MPEIAAHTFNFLWIFLKSGSAKLTQAQKSTESYRAKCFKQKHVHEHKIKKPHTGKLHNLSAGG